METMPIPKCPKCADGGHVRVVMVPVTESSVFKPLPEGWKQKAPTYQCRCGWTQPIELDEEEA